MIDHLVYATPDVVATTTELGDAWGIRLTPGGSHVGLGTRNELAGLGVGTYLEVVGPDPGQREPSGPRPFGIDDLSAAGLVAWCARPNRPLAEVVGAAGALGVDLGNITAMSRTRPDGVLLRWQLTFPLLGPPYHGVVPFLIDWQQSPHPTSSLPHDVALLALELTHPDAGLVRAMLAEIGRPTTRITVSDGEPSLSATLRTPAGIVTL